MAIFTTDHNNAGFERVQPGTYEVYAHDYQITQGMRTGNQILNMFYTVREDVNQPHQGVKISYDQFTLTEKAEWRFNAALKAAGVPHGVPFETLEQIAQALINKDIKVIVEMDKFDPAYPDKKLYPQIVEFQKTDQPNISNRPTPTLVLAYQQPSYIQNHSNNASGFPPSQVYNHAHHIQANQSMPPQSQQGYNNPAFGAQAYQSQTPPPSQLPFQTNSTPQQSPFDVPPKEEEKFDPKNPPF
ncbi:DUF669 domain-containing protein [Listeria booriae]|uniref:DUF669 domain-containing protein n=1 Tax=Listeria booriae TaxID=1552123 RepID=UPI0016268E03|nr:DUF669 domain-containing protein [Listeria booriae]MBC2100600.1 DUF669 domain-containing protein [Listeria booriae]MBC2392241.1 DUF669 domain-containing protein [Listeria booriae]